MDRTTQPRKNTHKTRRDKPVCADPMTMAMRNLAIASTHHAPAASVETTVGGADLSAVSPSADDKIAARTAEITKIANTYIAATKIAPFTCPECAKAPRGTTHLKFRPINWHQFDTTPEKAVKYCLNCRGRLAPLEQVEGIPLYRCATCCSAEPLLYVNYKFRRNTTYKHMGARDVAELEQLRDEKLEKIRVCPTAGCSGVRALCGFIPASKLPLLHTKPQRFTLQHKEDARNVAASLMAEYAAACSDDTSTATTHGADDLSTLSAAQPPPLCLFECDSTVWPTHEGDKRYSLADRLYFEIFMDIWQTTGDIPPFDTAKTALDEVYRRLAILPSK